MSPRVAVTAGFLAVTAVYAVGSRLLVGADQDWAAVQPTPPWQPPSVVFAIAWPLNFLAIAVTGAVLPRTDVRRSLPVLGLLAASVAAALGWAYLFYVPHALWAAAVALAAAALLTWAMLLAAGQVVRWTALLLAPYALWLTLAVSLAFWYADNL